MDFLIAIFILVLCYFIGDRIEKNHYKRIKERELKLYRKPYLSFAKNVNTSRPVKNVSLVASSVVLGCDNFKVFLANLRNIFGGNVSAYESVLDRGRREALLRIREKAATLGANIVLNVKLETVILTPFGSNRLPQVSVIAYGTAVAYG